jgi:hypothetical protein
MAKAILHMTIKREYFNRIAQGVKRKEYRDCTEYWAKRLKGRSYDIVRFRNGYASDAPVVEVEFLGVEDLGDCFAILLGQEVDTCK